MTVYEDIIREKIRKGEKLWTEDMLERSDQAKAQRIRLFIAYRRLLPTLTAEELTILDYSNGSYALAELRSYQRKVQRRLLANKHSLGLRAE